MQSRLFFHLCTRTFQFAIFVVKIRHAAGVLKGKTCSSYPAVGPDVTLAGGTYADIAVDRAQVDGNLVTAPAWPAHPEWLAKFLEILGTKIEP